jgi:hypothetical protein
MNLRLIGWKRDVTSGDPPTIIVYGVDNMPPNMTCVIGDAGIGQDRKRKWYAHLYESGTGAILAHLGSSDTPQDALDLVAEFCTRHAATPPL